jgi:hypothetical protein
MDWGWGMLPSNRFALEAGALVIFCSTKVFHSPQEGQRPSHFAESFPQFWQRYTVLDLAIVVYGC